MLSYVLPVNLMQICRSWHSPNSLGLSIDTCWIEVLFSLQNQSQAPWGIRGGAECKTGVSEPKPKANGLGLIPDSAISDEQKEMAWSRKITLPTHPSPTKQIPKGKGKANCDTNQLKGRENYFTLFYITFVLFLLCSVVAFPFIRPRVTTSTKNFELLKSARSLFVPFFPHSSMWPRQLSQIRVSFQHNKAIWTKSQQSMSGRPMQVWKSLHSPDSLGWIIFCWIEAL